MCSRFRASSLIGATSGVARPLSSARLRQAGNLAGFNRIGWRDRCRPFEMVSQFAHIAGRGVSSSIDEQELELRLILKTLFEHFVEQVRFRRVGSTRDQTSDVRVIAATNRNVTMPVERNEFRADLFYRLNVVSLRLPPLRNDPKMFQSWFIASSAHTGNDSIGQDSVVSNEAENQRVAPHHLAEARCE